MAVAEPLWCIVPAAGQGTRFSTQLPKQHAMFGGQTLLMWTLQRLAASAHIGGLMVVLSATDRHWQRCDNVAGKPVLTSEGAAVRSGSVLAGLHALPTSVSEHDFVLVHDAARPCVLTRDIAQLIEQGIAAGGALLAAPLRDTLKRDDGSGRVLVTEPRESRWRALTPQLFRRGELVCALQAAQEAGIAVTDEAMAMERAGHRPLLVEGSESNIKVTTAADLRLAEYLLRQESERAGGQS